MFEIEDEVKLLDTGLQVPRWELSAQKHRLSYVSVPSRRVALHPILRIRPCLVDVAK